MRSRNSTSGKNKSKIDRLIGVGVQLFSDLVSVVDHTFTFASIGKNSVA